MKSYLKKLLKAPKIPFLIFIYSLSFSMLIIGIKFFHPETAESPEQIQENIADNIIRLHVIANSDTDDDQELKLKVRDGIIEQLQNTVASSKSVTDAEKLLYSQEENIKNSALNIISDSGYDYTVNVSLKERYFPVKSYGDLVFPAGDYKALCVEIGKANGRNWWCVLFPSLCFVDETYAVVPDNSKEKLKETLSEEEYESLTQYTVKTENNTDAKEDISNNYSEENLTGNKFFIHSAIYDWLKNITS